jgi:hypothetical protein
MLDAPDDGDWILWGFLRDGQLARFQNRLGNHAVKLWGGFRNPAEEPERSFKPLRPCG